MTVNSFLFNYAFKYLIYGFYISIALMFVYTELHLALLYLVVGTLFTLIAVVTIKYSNYIYTALITMYMYIGYLFQLPLLSINRDEYTYGSLGSIGNYEFGFFQTIHIYIYVFAFLLVNLSVGVLFRKKKYILNLNQLLGMVRRREIKGKSKSYLIAYLVIIIQLILNIFMYIHKIGIPGLRPDALPYNLTGGLYYYRYFIYASILIFLVFRGGLDSRALIWMMVLEMVQASFLSTSKGIVFLHSLPIFFLFFLNGKINWMVLLFIFDLLLLPYIVLGRNIFYHEETLTIPLFFETIVYIFNFDADYSIIGRGAGLFVKRMLGLKEFAMSTYSPCAVETNLMVYFNKVLSLVSNEYDFGRDCMYGFPISEINKRGKAFGYALDILSYIRISTSGPVMFVLLSAFHTGVYLFMEKSIVYSIRLVVKNSAFAILLSIGLIFISILQLYKVKYVILVMMAVFAFKLISGYQTKKERYRVGESREKRQEAGSS